MHMPPQGAVVIAGNVKNLGAVAALGKHQFHDPLVDRRPVPAAVQQPEVEDVAHQIEVLGIMVFEKIQKIVAVSVAGAEVEVGEPDGTIGFLLHAHRIAEV